MYDLICVYPLDWQRGDDPLSYCNVRFYGEDEATFWFRYMGRIITYNKAAVLGWSVG